jgi:hypothetical protein
LSAGVLSSEAGRCSVVKNSVGWQLADISLPFQLPGSKPNNSFWVQHNGLMQLWTYVLSIAIAKNVSKVFDMRPWRTLIQSDSPETFGSTVRLGSRRRLTDCSASFRMVLTALAMSASSPHVAGFSVRPRTLLRC